MVKSKLNGLASDADNAAIREMENIANNYHAADNDGCRLRIHLILRNQQLVDSLRRIPLAGSLMDNIELYAYTYADLQSLYAIGALPNGQLRLDRKPITADSDCVAHLVVFGASQQAESLAIHAALVAHYPNYNRDCNLRTRITMVSESIVDFQPFRQRYQNLLLHSYSRQVIVNGNGITATVSQPKYAGYRKDFIDIEWEFVECSSPNQALNYKLIKWAKVPTNK